MNMLSSILVNHHNQYPRSLAISIEKGDESSTPPSAEPKPIGASTPRDQWLSQIAQDVLAAREQKEKGIASIPAEVIHSHALAAMNEDGAWHEAIDAISKVLPKKSFGMPEDASDEDYRKTLEDFSIISVAQDEAGKPYTLRFSLHGHGIPADKYEEFAKQLEANGFPKDDEYNRHYRGYVLQHGFQKVGHAGAIEIDDDLLGAIKQVDFNPEKHQLEVKLISGKENAESNVTITKDKLSASNSADAALAALVASAKAAGWESYKITAEGGDLLNTALAFEQNKLKLDQETQKLVQEALQNAGGHKDLKAWAAAKKKPASAPPSSPGADPGASNP